MKRSIGTGVLFTVFFSYQALCFGQAIPSAELISQAKKFDKTTVVYAGEAIGEVMARGDFAWVNVNDGTNAVGVWMPAAMAAGIRYAGGFTHTGDWIEVTGTFNRACTEHGGDLDIHAQAVAIVRPGEPTGRGCDAKKKDWAIKLLGVLAVVWILSLLKLK